jgi:short-subunit dehydrogenase
MKIRDRREALKVHLKKIEDQVIVVTGASSGIGLTVARMAAQRGAAVVLAARDQNMLERLRDEITGAGGKALPVAADVSHFDDVHALAEKTIQYFGRLDTWVNNSGGSIYGQTLDVPVEEERKLFEVNYWGVVYGSRIAAKYLRTHGGALINLGSVASDRAIPLQAAYSASKHAVKAYTDALRSELEKDGAPVSVTLILLNQADHWS